jgi:hypothetical protein
MHRLSHRWAVTLVAAALVAGVACGGGQANAQKKPKADKPVIEHYTQDATFRFEASGHRTGRYEGSGRLRVLSFTGVQRIGSSVTLGTDPPMQLSPDEGAEVYITVASEKDGEFTINRTGTATGRAQSTVYVTMFKGTLGEAAEGGRYDEVMVPCSGTISGRGASGRLTCETLVDRTTNASIKLSFEWETRGEKTPQSTSATTAASTTQTSGP